MRAPCERDCSIDMKLTLLRISSDISEFTGKHLLASYLIGFIGSGALAKLMQALVDRHHFGIERLEDGADRAGGLGQGARAAALYPT